MNEPWMNDLKTRLGDYRQKAPEGLLDDVRREMTRRAVVPASVPKTPVIKMTMWKRAAAVVALLLVSGMALRLLDTEVKPQADAVKVSEVMLEETTGGNGVKADVASEDEIAKVDIGKAIKATRRTGIAMAEPSHRASEMLSPTSDEVKTGADSSREESVDGREDSVDGRQDSVDGRQDTIASQTPEPELLATRTLPTRRSKRNDRAWSIGAYFGGEGLSNGSSPTGGTINDVPYSYAEPVPGGTNIVIEDQPVSLPDEHHDLPIKVGLSLRFRLNERWSLVSGINYSYLRSDVHVTMGAKTMPAVQKLHYLGIPLMVSYNLWGSQRCNVYLTAGGEVEKLVNGRQTMDRGNSQQAVTERVKEGQPVFSTKAAAGIEWLFGHNFGLYVEPGASYCIDNGSGIRSAYTDHPWNFDINVGARIYFDR